MAPMKANTVAASVVKPGKFATAVGAMKVSAPAKRGKKEAEAPTKKGKKEADAPAKKGKKEEDTPAEKATTVAAPLVKPGKFAKAVGRKSIGTKVVEDEVPAMKGMKRPAAAMKDAEAPAKKGKKAPEKVSEENVVAERAKELKAMPVADLKDFAKSKGLERGTKAEMIDQVLALEAKARDEARAQAAKVKEIVNKIAGDIAAKSMPELKELCDSKALKKGGSKTELVERLVEQAKKDGEVDKVIAGIARDATREKLIALEKTDLQKLCTKAGIDPLVKEVMVERLLAAEANP